jgi:putative membrane protein insertion efficiency factor
MQDFMGETLISNFIIFLIRSYKRFLSPHLKSSCRYYPTCSEYAIDAIEQKGLIIGVRTAIIRLLRCNGLFKGGYDPVK